jgi:hypothetical protein
MSLLTLPGILSLRRFVLTSIAAAWLLYLPAALAEAPPLDAAEAAPPVDDGPTQLLANPGFEEGASGWSSTVYKFAVNSSGAAHQGDYLAWLGGFGDRNSETLYQDVSIPADAHHATFSFWVNIVTDETSRRQAYDKLYVQVRTPEGRVLRTLATYSNLNRTQGYVRKTFDVSRFAGRDVQMFLKVVEDNRKPSSFFLDDVTLTVQ